MNTESNKLGYKNKYYTFLKNTEKIPNSMDLLELSTELNYNESQSSIRHAACQICNNIATNPKMCEECEVLYCGNCTATLLLGSNNDNQISCKNCPEALILKPLSKSLQRIIDDFHLRCPSLNDNCNQPILFRDLVDHLDDCKYWIGFSKCLGCGLIGKTHAIEDHVLACPFTYFKCDICSNIVKRKETEIHRETCTKIFPNCELCKALKTRMDDLEEKLFNKINSLEDMIDFQQKKFNQLNQRVHDLENTNTMLEAQLMNKEFKAAVLNQIEDLSNKQAYEIKNIKRKIQTIANDGLYLKDTEFSKNLDLNINLNSSSNDINPNNLKILTSPNNRNRNDYEFEKNYDNEFLNGDILRNNLRFNSVSTSRNINNKIDFLEDLINKGNQGNTLLSSRNSYNFNSHTNSLSQNISNNFNANGNVVSPKTTVFSNINKTLPVSKEKYNLKNLVQNRLSKSSSNFNLSNRFENKTLNCFQVLKGHESAINCLILLKGRDQDYVIITGSQDGDIKVWHYLTGECLRTLMGHLDCVTSITKIRRKELIISASDDKLIKIWEYNSGRCLKTLQGHSHWIKKIIFMKWDRNDSTIVTASSDKTVRIWNIETDICNILKGHKHEVISLAQIGWLKDQTTIASGSWKEIKLWNVITGDNISTFSNNKNWIRSLIYIKYTPENDYLVSASNNEIKLWNLKNGKCVNSFDTEDTFINCIYELKIKQKDIIVASAGSDKSVKLWNVETSKLVSRIVGHGDIVKGIAQPDKEDGVVILTGSADKTIRYWK